MRRLVNISKIVIGLFLLNTVFILKVQAFGEIQISEINYTGYTVWQDSETSKSSDEFIEIYNNTESTVNLTGYKLRIISGNSDKEIILEGSVDPKDYLVIRKVTQTQKKTLKPLDKVIFSSDFNLSNTAGAFMEIRDNNGLTIDSINFWGKWPLDTENGYSLHRINNHIWESKKISLFQKEYLEPVIEEVLEEIETSEIKEEIIPNYDNTLRISEFLPDQGAKFESEFVEIENLTDKDIDLAGWILDDVLTGGSSLKNLTGVIPAFGLYSIRVSILNNYNSNPDLYEEVNLISPDGKLQNSQRYLLKDVKKELSLASINGKFEWTNQPTENLPNKPSLIMESPKVEEIIEDENTSEDIEKDSIQNIQNIESGWLYFTEFLANPKAGTENEFIEIYNSTNQIIKLDGWKLGDLAKTITLSGEVKPYSYRVFSNKETKITLNNSGETVKLIKPDGSIYQEITIPELEVDQSYSKFEDRWLFTTTITEGKDNILTEPIKVETKQAKSQKSANPTNGIEDDKIEYKSMNLSELGEANHNDKVQLTGIVFVELNKIYKNSFYITDGKRVIRITVPNNSDYEINLNQNLTLNGSIHKTKTQTYLKLEDISGVEQKTFSPKFVMTDSLNSNNAFVQLSGILATNTATKLSIISEDTKKENIIKISDNTFKKPIMRKGDKVVVQGFVEEYDGVLRLVPYKQNQISVEKEDKLETDTKDTNNKIILASSSVNSSNMEGQISKYVPWEDYSTDNDEVLKQTNFAKWLDNVWKSIQDMIPKQLKQNKFFVVIFVINIIWWILSSMKFKKNQYGK